MNSMTGDGELEGPGAAGAPDTDADTAAEARTGVAIGILVVTLLALLFFFYWRTTGYRDESGRRPPPPPAGILP